MTDNISNSGDSALFAGYPDILSVKQLQSALQIGRNKAYDLIKNNSIKYFKAGKEIKIPKQYLIDYIEDSCYNGGATGKLRIIKEAAI